MFSSWLSMLMGFSADPSSAGIEQWVGEELFDEAEEGLDGGNGVGTWGGSSGKGSMGVRTEPTLSSVISVGVGNRLYSVSEGLILHDVIEEFLLLVVMVLVKFNF